MKFRQLCERKMNVYLLAVCSLLKHFTSCGFGEQVLPTVHCGCVQRSGFFQHTACLQALFSRYSTSLSINGHWAVSETPRKRKCMGQQQLASELRISVWGSLILPIEQKFPFLRNIFFEFSCNIHTLFAFMYIDAVSVTFMDTLFF